MYSRVPNRRQVWDKKYSVFPYFLRGKLFFLRFQISLFYVQSLEENEETIQGGELFKGGY